MNYIACVDENWGIGKNGDLLFSIKGDMKFFRETTLGKTVVMGRKTLLSFPGSKPLKIRRNIVLTKNRDFSCEGAEIVHSTEELSALLKNDKADSDNILSSEGHKFTMPFINSAKQHILLRYRPTEMPMCL